MGEYGEDAIERDMEMWIQQEEDGYVEPNPPSEPSNTLPKRPSKRNARGKK